MNTTSARQVIRDGDTLARPGETLNILITNTAAVVTPFFNLGNSQTMADAWGKQATPVIAQPLADRDFVSLRTGRPTPPPSTFFIE